MNIQKFLDIIKNQQAGPKIIHMAVMIGIMLQLLLHENPPKGFPSQLLSTKKLQENIPRFNMAFQY